MVTSCGDFGYGFRQGDGEGGALDGGLGGEERDALGGAGAAPAVDLAGGGEEEGGAVAGGDLGPFWGVYVWEWDGVGGGFEGVDVWFRRGGGGVVVVEGEVFEVFFQPGGAGVSSQGTVVVDAPGEDFVCGGEGGAVHTADGELDYFVFDCGK